MCESNPILTQSEDFSRSREKLRKTYEDIYKDAPHKPFVLGSTFDGLLMPMIIRRKEDITQMCIDDPSEFVKRITVGDVDVMTIATGKIVGNVDQPYTEAYLYHIETKETSPGYLRLVHVDPENTGEYIIHRDGKAHLSSSKIMEDLVTEAASRMSLGYTAQQTGPALTVIGPGPLERDTDSVVGLPCPVWPKQAQEWLKRNRPSNWPSEELRQDIVAGGCHVVPVAHKKSDWPEVEWRMSFAVAEQKLSKSLTVPQRQCYLTLKALVKYELSPPDLLSSYCLKNHMFTCLEKIPAETWEDEVNGLGAAFLYIVDELMYALINENLPHYFMPANNLISHISEFFLDELMAKVSRLRRDPIKYMLSFDKNHFFQHSSMTTCLPTLLQPVLEDSKLFHNNLKQCYNTQFQSLLRMCPVFLQECNFPMAYAVSEATCAIGRHLDHTLEPIEVMENFLLKLTDPKKAILGFEYIKDTIADIPGSFLGNLGCMYTSLYCSEPDGTARDEYRDKADDNFHKSLMEQGIRGACGVDYSIFLRKCGRSQEAIPLLVKVLSQEMECSNMYGQSEKSSMDEHLAAEIESSDEVSAPSLFFAFYQLVHCYLETEQQDMATELMPDFSMACEQLKHQDAFVYSLLGYTYMDQGDYKAAQEAFNKALEIRPDHELTRNNHTLCEAMLMSLGSE